MRYTVLSRKRLAELVEGGADVAAWRCVETAKVLHAWVRDGDAYRRLCDGMRWELSRLGADDDRYPRCVRCARVYARLGLAERGRSRG